MTYELSQTNRGFWCVNLRDGDIVFRGPVFSPDLNGRNKATEYIDWSNKQHTENWRLGRN